MMNRRKDFVFKVSPSSETGKTSNYTILMIFLTDRPISVLFMDNVLVYPRIVVVKQLKDCNRHVTVTGLTLISVLKVFIFVQSS